jgi:hypothetical protein
MSEFLGEQKQLLERAILDAFIYFLLHYLDFVVSDSANLASLFQSKENS